MKVELAFSEVLKQNLISKIIESEVKNINLKKKSEIICYSVQRTIELTSKDVVMIDHGKGIFTAELLSKEELTEMTVKEEKEKFRCSCMGSYPPNCNCGKFDLNN